MRSAAVAGVLFDRDGTLVQDVPYNGEPVAVRPLPGVRSALHRLRSAGIPVGVLTNQSGIARGLLTWRQLRRVNERIERLLGPFALWQVCPHGPADGCRCRKPRPGMVLDAARRLATAPTALAVVGDIGADIAAAAAAGAHGVLVPTPATLPEEVTAAPVVAPDLPAAVDLLLAGAPDRPRCRHRTGAASC